MPFPNIIVWDLCRTAIPLQGTSSFQILFTNRSLIQNTASSSIWYGYLIWTINMYHTFARASYLVFSPAGHTELIRLQRRKNVPHPQDPGYPPSPIREKLWLFFTTEIVKVTLNIAAFLTGCFSIKNWAQIPPSPHPDRSTNVTTAFTAEAM